MSNGVVRLFKSGLRNADERVGKLLAPRPSIAADRYLASSVTIRAVDRLLQRWPALWSNSVARITLVAPLGWSRESAWRVRYASIGWTLIIAAVTHVILSLSHGPRPGWFWAVLPAMAAGFGVLLVTASRSLPRL